MSISIIMPVYNVEKYVGKCIESVLSQDFTDYEFIIVDDGSKDNSGSICDKYAEKDSRIKVYHKQNGGVDSARNFGIEKAVGKYLYFVDSDDEVLPGCLSTLLKGFKDPNIDLSIAGYIYSTDGEKQIWRRI